MSELCVVFVPATDDDMDATDSVYITHEGAHAGILVWQHEIEFLIAELQALAAKHRRRWERQLVSS